MKVFLLFRFIGLEFREREDRFFCMFRFGLRWTNVVVAAWRHFPGGGKVSHGYNRYRLIEREDSSNKSIGPVISRALREFAVQ